MPARWNKLCIQTNARESFHEPLRAFGKTFRIVIVGRNAWKSQEGIKILEIIFTHDHKLIGFRSLPTISAGVGRERSTRSTQAQALSQSREIREPSHGRESKESRRLPARAQFAFQGN